MRHQHYWTINLSGRRFRAQNDGGITIKFSGEPPNPPSVRLLDMETQNVVASWLANNLVSEVALRKFAAAMREIATWSAQKLVIPGKEWSPDDSRPALVFWMDFGEIVIRPLTKDRIRLSFRIMGDDHRYTSFIYEFNTKSCSLFGQELTDALNKYGEW